MSLIQKPWGALTIKATEEELMDFLRNNCFEDISEISYSLDSKAEEYGLVIYSGSFKVWRLGSTRYPSQYTVLEVKIIPLNPGITLKWYVRPNYLQIVFLLLVLSVSMYLIIQMLLNGLVLKTTLSVLFINLILWLSHLSNTNDSLRFIQKLDTAFNKQ